MSVDFSRHPNAADVMSLLQSSGFWPVAAEAIELANFQAEAGVAAAVEEFQRRTGWYPFLSSGNANEARTFQRRDGAFGFRYNGCLELNAGLLALSGVTVDGRAFTVGKDFTLRPSDARSRNKPHTYLVISRWWSDYTVGWPQEIVVSGKWGFCETVPPDVWEAERRYAAVNVLSELNVDQDVSSISQDGFSKQWDVVGTIAPKDILGEWPKSFDRTVERYVRVT